MMNILLGSHKDIQILIAILIGVITFFVTVETVRSSILSLIQWFKK